MRASGWLTLVAAWGAWTLASGVEFGTVFALTTPALVAVALVWKHRKRRPGPPATPRGSTVAQNSAERGTALMLHSTRLLLTVPLAAAASLHAGTAIAVLLPLTRPDALALGILLLPLLWGLSAYWMLMAPRFWLPAVIVSGSGVAAALLIHG